MIVHCCFIFIYININIFIHNIHCTYFIKIFLIKNNKIEMTNVLISQQRHHNIPKCIRLIFVREILIYSIVSKEYTADTIILIRSPKMFHRRNPSKRFRARRNFKCVKVEKASPRGILT